MVAEREAVASAFAAMGADNADWAAYVRATFDERYEDEQRDLRRRSEAVAELVRRDIGAVSDKLAEVAYAALLPLEEACDADSWQDFLLLLKGAASHVRLNVGRRKPPDSDLKGGAEGAAR